MVFSGCAPARSPAPTASPTPSLSPAEAAAAVRVSVTLKDRSLAATSAVADFGIKQGIRMVRVRILDDLEIQVQIASDTTITLAGPPVVCLVGPFSAPDDAGLADRCWGDPDLRALVAAQLSTDATGHPMLQAGHPIAVDAVLHRGARRCDYPPGRWVLEVALGPVGVATTAHANPVDLPPVKFDITPTTDQPLTLLKVLDTRYCGLAATVYLTQGEPPIRP